MYQDEPKGILRRINQPSNPKRVRFTNVNKRKPRRTKHNNQLTSINVLYANVRGIKKKVTSLESALQSHGTHTATIAETKLGTIPAIVKGYRWFTKNKHAGTGGIAVLTRDDITNKVKVVHSLEQEDMEILWVEIETSHSPTFIGIYYGPQENAPAEEVERQFETLSTNIPTIA